MAPKAVIACMEQGKGTNKTNGFCSGRSRRLSMVHRALNCRNKEITCVPGGFAVTQPGFGVAKNDKLMLFSNIDSNMDSTEAN
jgi:hypothetical protein